MKPVRLPRFALVLCVTCLGAASPALPIAPAHTGAVGLEEPASVAPPPRAVPLKDEGPVPAPGASDQSPAAAIAVGKPLSDPASVTLTPEQLEAYVGRYRTVSGARHSVTREGGRLFVLLGGQERREVFPTAADVFFEKGSFLRLRFDRDGAGKAVRLVVDNWGAEPAAVRDDTPDKPAPVAAKVDTAVYRAYAGEYELAPGFVLTVTLEGDRIMTQATGQSKVEVFPSSPTEFFLKVVDARITFVKSEAGAVTHLVLHQGGRDMPAKKIK